MEYKIFKKKLVIIKTDIIKNNDYLNIKEFSCTEEDIISTDKYLNFCRKNNIATDEDIFKSNEINHKKEYQNILYL